MLDFWKIGCSVEAESSEQDVEIDAGHDAEAWLLGQ
jgi:hypothetical protein